ncbi:hypothetical protein [Bacillus cereus]|nr:hypothetical protein [Bacillus cereus]
MEIKIKSKESELLLKMSNAVALAIISALSTGIGALAVKLLG